ncbi:MAG: hypothetical protein BWY02_02678 [bacterium ADurb.Bin157]|nr:MAG: hypothetical protein BWY02_02678 [bacterium ADurb.Bin157]
MYRSVFSLAVLVCLLAIVGNQSVICFASNTATFDSPLKLAQFLFQAQYLNVHSDAEIARLEPPSVEYFGKSFMLWSDEDFDSFLAAVKKFAEEGASPLVGKNDVSSWKDCFGSERTSNVFHNADFAIEKSLEFVKNVKEKSDLNKYRQQHALQNKARHDEYLKKAKESTITTIVNQPVTNTTPMKPTAVTKPSSGNSLNLESPLPLAQFFFWAQSRYGSSFGELNEFTENLLGKALLAWTEEDFAAVTAAVQRHVEEGPNALFSTEYIPRWTDVNNAVRDTACFTTRDRALKESAKLLVLFKNERADFLAKQRADEQKALALKMRKIEEEKNVKEKEKQRLEFKLQEEKQKAEQRRLKELEEKELAAIPAGILYSTKGPVIKGLSIGSCAIEALKILKEKIPQDVWAISKLGNGYMISGQLLLSGPVVITADKDKRVNLIAFQDTNNLFNTTDLTAEQFVKEIISAYKIPSMQTYIRQEGTSLEKGWEYSSQEGWKISINYSKHLILSAIAKPSERTFD